MNFGDSEIGLYHYLVCHEDNFILNSLEKVDLSGYLYRRLRESGYERIVFFQNSGAAFQLVTYDRLSYYSYLFPNDYDKSTSNEDFFKSMMERESGAAKGPVLSHNIKTQVNNSNNIKPFGKTEHKIRITDGQTLYSEILQRFRPALTGSKIKTAIVCPYEIFSLLPRSLSNETALLLKSLNSRRSPKNIVLFTFEQGEELIYFSDHPLLKEIFTEFRVVNYQSISDGSYLSKLKDKVGDRLIVANHIGKDEIANLFTRLALKGNRKIDITRIDDMASVITSQLRGGEKRIQTLPDVKAAVIKVLEEKTADDIVMEEINEVVKNMSSNSALEELKKTVGMSKVVERLEEIIKRFEQNRLIKSVPSHKNALEIERFHISDKNQGSGVRLNLLLLGNPGTGKTMVARQYGRLLKELGILPIGHMVEVSKASLKGAYVGHSVRNIREKIQEAMGGVLFVDEVYQFASGEDGTPGDSFEREIMEVFLKALEDHQGKFAAVFAGYEKKTLNLIKQYEGLMSRFLEPIIIEDYTASDLYEIFKNNVTRDRITLSDDFAMISKDFISNWYRQRRSSDREWANVRTFNEEFYNKLTDHLKSDRIMDATCVPDSLKPYYKEYKDLGPEYIDVLFEKIIGLAPVKEKIKSIIEQIPKRKLFPELFEEDGIGNFLFYGNPGTGKTRMAHVMAEFLSQTGILKTGRVFNVKADDIIKSPQGGSSKAIARIFEEAIGGIVVIDEIGSLSQLPKDAHKVLIQQMEENRKEICVIFTGYKHEFNDLLKIEEGYERRIQNKIEFPDYTAEELFDIFMLNLSGYTTVTFVIGESEKRMLKSFFEYVLDQGISHDNATLSKKIATEIKNKAILRLKEGQSNIEILESDILNVAQKNGVPAIALRTDRNVDKGDFEELDRLIGLDNVKRKVRTIVNSIKYGNRDAGPGHFIFYGNSGTGKTHVARIMGNLFKSMGILQNGHTVEVTKADLVAGYVGQTSMKTLEKCREALGGVLFIDEAYNLTTGRDQGGSFGQEAYDELMKFMDDHRKEICVIFAGYADEMKAFESMNPGMKSRVLPSNRIYFPDYDKNQLVDILKIMAEDQELILHEEYIQDSQNVFESWCIKGDRNFGNARAVRNFLAESIGEKGNRLAELDNQGVEITEEMMRTLMKEDIPEHYRVDLNGKKPVNKFVPIDKNHFMEHYSVVKHLSYDDSESFFSEVGKSLLYIKVKIGDNCSYGSGFLISPSGYAITCHHVIEQAIEIEARVRIEGRPGGKDSWHTCTVLKTIPGLDIALLKLEGENFPYMRIADEERQIKRGEKIVVMGYPFGARTERDFTAFNGTIASSEDQSDDYGEIYFLNSEAKSGNSGGPVISQNSGEVLGILVGSQMEDSGSLVEEINYMRPMKYFWSLFTR